MHITSPFPVALEGAVPGTAAPSRQAGPRQAQAALGLQLAEGVLVGHSGSHSQPTRGGAGAPGGAPFWAGDTRGCRSNKARKLGSLGLEGLDGPPCRLVTHPLGAALAGDLHPPGARAVPAGQPDVLAAQWQAGEATVLAAAEDPAVRLEGLPVLVQAAVQLAAPVVLSQEAHRPSATRA